MQSYLLDCKIVYNAVILQHLMHMTILIVVVVIKLHPSIHPPLTLRVFLPVRSKECGPRYDIDSDGNMEDVLSRVRPLKIDH